MRIEIGDFSGMTEWMLATAKARVIVGAEDFERLELREFEDGRRLSPCLGWCHESVGAGYLNWELVSAGEVDIFYFSRPQDAQRFWALYGTPREETRISRLRHDLSNIAVVSFPSYAS